LTEAFREFGTELIRRVKPEATDQG
jgi:hypothetical protein